MRRSWILAAVAGLSLAGSALAAGVDELPQELAGHLYDRSKMDAGLPTGPSAYRTWKSAKKPPWTFGYVGSTRYGTWSDAALKQATDVLEPKWEGLGLSRKLIAPPAAKDDAEASRLIRDLADQGADAILVCCGSPTGLNDAINYAHGKGALTVTFFGFSTSPYALNVTTNFYRVGGQFADQMADELEGKGNVLVVGGFLGAPASQALDRGLRAGFAAHPGMKLVGDIPVEGGSEAARAAVTAWLASHKDRVDGIIARAGAEADILKPFSEAGRKPPIPMIGGDSGSVCYWRHNPTFVSASYYPHAMVGWPPADEMTAAYDVAQRTLQGQGPKAQSILVEAVLVNDIMLRSLTPESCDETDLGWIPVGADIWAGVNALNQYFARPADPLAYKP